MEPLLNRFLRYVKYDTQADATAGVVPSSPGQKKLALLLADELRGLGLADVVVDEHAYVTATLPARDAPRAPVIGLLAHLDTACEASGAQVRPRVIPAYDGKDIPLNAQMRLSPARFPELRDQIGKTLVVTDGTTLLGADDKAGIAVIMNVLDHCVSHPDQAHGAIKVAFVPDEEIGHGAELLDPAAFGADFAYTVDGTGLGTIEYENFNAAKADVFIRGLSVHPGHAKGLLINAVLVAQSFLDRLPAGEIPALTENREGFYHVTHLNGDVSAAHIGLIIRDHDRKHFEARKDFLIRLTEELNARWPSDEGPRIRLEMSDQYRNMLEKIDPHKHIVDTAVKAIREAGITPHIKPIRGGTDGARLSWRGLPTPNLFAGDHNAHGPYEFVAVEDMEASARTILNILRAYAGKK